MQPNKTAAKLGSSACKPADMKATFTGCYSIVYQGPLQPITAEIPADLASTDGLHISKLGMRPVQHWLHDIGTSIHECLGINHLSVLALELLVICYCNV